jgi:hypothetical protein
MIFGYQRTGLLGCTRLLAVGVYYTLRGLGGECNSSMLVCSFLSTLKASFRGIRAYRVYLKFCLQRIYDTIISCVSARYTSMDVIRVRCTISWQSRG